MILVRTDHPCLRVGRHSGGFSHDTGRGQGGQSPALGHGGSLGGHNCSMDNSGRP
jgi:hypothetical protein